MEMKYQISLGAKTIRRLFRGSRYVHNYHFLIFKTDCKINIVAFAVKNKNSFTNKFKKANHLSRVITGHRYLGPPQSKLKS